MSIEFKTNPEDEPKFRERYKEYYDYLRPLGDVFASYGAYHIKVEPKAGTFYFDHRNRTIYISPRLIEELQLEREEQKFIFLHELGHLIQLFQDPDAYLRSFSIPREISERESDPYLKEALQKAYRHFFNVFFDIHDNSIIIQRMPIYQEERGREISKTLYQQKAFPKLDYSDLPYSTQFLYYLLRRIMVPDEEIVISQEVREVIQERISFFGTEYESIEDFVREEIFNPHKTIDDVMFILKEFLLPIYEELIKKDIEEGRIQNIPDFIGEINIDEGLDEDAIKRITESIKEGQKSAEDRYKDYLDKQLEEWAKGKGFSEEEIKRVKEIRETTLRMVRELEDLWNNFIQRSIEIARNKVSGFRTGATIDTTELLKNLPIILTQPSEAKIFSRYLPETTAESIKPRKINLILIIDLSGSMDEKKRKAVQEVAYAINKSLINFYRTGKLQFADTGEEFPIAINYQIIGFGSSVIELTKTTEEERRERVKKDRPNKDLDEELLRAIIKIREINLGGTQDALALRMVQKDIDQELEEKLKNGDEIMVILEITDGETETVVDSKELVEELNSFPNVYCRAIQIPGPIYSEEIKEEPTQGHRPPKLLLPTGTFKEVWGDEWGKRLEDLSVLKETIVAILYDALKHYAT